MMIELQFTQAYNGGSSVFLTCKQVQQICPLHLHFRITDIGTFLYLLKSGEMSSVDTTEEHCRQSHLPNISSSDCHSFLAYSVPERKIFHPKRS